MMCKIQQGRGPGCAVDKCKNFAIIAVSAGSDDGAYGLGAVEKSSPALQIMTDLRMHFVVCNDRLNTENFEREAQDVRNIRDSISPLMAIAHVYGAKLRRSAHFSEAE